MNPALAIGVDVGGTHATAALVDTAGPEVRGESLRRVAMDSRAEAGSILEMLAGLVTQIALAAPTASGPFPLGLSFPGPFDYARGLALLRPPGKYGALFGLDLGQWLATRLARESVGSVRFVNDAVCFAWGWHQSRRIAPEENTLAVTLGTGLGSAFVLDGKICAAGPCVPPGGFLYQQPFRASRADEYFSTRWLVRRYHELTGVTPAHGRELCDKAAQAGGEIARAVFSELAANLAEFLAPWLRQAEIRRLVVGGNLCHAWPFFGDPLARNLAAGGLKIAVERAVDTEAAAVAGAALFAAEPPPLRAVRRKTAQPALPLSQPRRACDDGYEIYPTQKVEGGRIHQGLTGLVETLAGAPCIVIDGYQGVFWDDVRREVDAAFRARGIQPNWLCVDAALRRENDIAALVAPFLGETGSIFGTRFTGELRAFFDADALRLLRPMPDRFSVLYGSGAALAEWNGPLVYIDVPKNEIQFRLRAGSVTNLGMEFPGVASATYKRCYFIDWIALNAHKQTLLPRLDYFVDGQRDGAFTWMTGEDLRTSLRRIAREPLRVRPWFEPGVWGGHWMKRRFAGLNQSVPNYAWSFELITPENGIVLAGSDGLLLEASFDLLMFQEHRAVLGQAASRFGVEFPIRFDFLDTWDGGDLSIQVHPAPAYIRKHFGENFTQDETYYILDAQENAKVYLGLQTDVGPSELAGDLDDSHQAHRPLDTGRFVQSFPARRHDLFLIPHGAVHGAGRGSLVLEISSTPYIFTFKLYDWLRPDLDGRPRPLNLGHGLANLDFSLQGDTVVRELISRPEVLEEGPDWRRERLPTHERHFYEIERWTFTRSLNVPADGQCHVLMLVDGKRIEIVTRAGARRVFAFAETFVVPAEAGPYMVRNQGDSPAMLIRARVKNTRVA